MTAEAKADQVTVLNKLAVWLLRLKERNLQWQ